jgi:hypothetical protein
LVSRCSSRCPTCRAASLGGWQEGPRQELRLKIYKEVVVLLLLPCLQDELFEEEEEGEQGRTSDSGGSSEGEESGSGSEPSFDSEAENQAPAQGRRPARATAAAKGRAKAGKAAAGEYGAPMDDEWNAQWGLH